MGQMVGRLTDQCTGSVSDIISGRRKRKRSENVDESLDESQQQEASSPKKKKLLTMTQYIYQALFKEEQDSDITVMAMGKTWHLHKVYLRQSPYFETMFNGSWLESNLPFVHIKIVDDRITLEGLDAVLGSLYSDEIVIDPKDVISILATATLFHLESIIDKCSEVMIENINNETAIDYYEAACLYGCLNVKKETYKWLETNLLCIYGKNLKMLRQMSAELLTSLITSNNLYVMQTEYSLYSLLRTWIYLRLHPDYDPENQLQQQQLKAKIEREPANDKESNTPVDIIQSFFAKRSKHCSFLATPEGKPFVEPFKYLRTQYLVNHLADLRNVRADNIVPMEWINAHVLNNWQTLLETDHQPEEGPKNLDAEVFHKNCMRFGRILLEPGYQKWRWTGFNFGLDLILIADARLLSIRRHHRAEHERVLSLQAKRQFMVRTSITSINAQRQPIYTQTSDILSLSLEKNEESTLMLMNPQLVHPLLISVNLLVVPPMNMSFKENIRTWEEANSLPISEFGGEVALHSSAPMCANDSAVCLMLPANEDNNAARRAGSTNSTASTASSYTSTASSAASSSSSVD